MRHVVFALLALLAIFARPAHAQYAEPDWQSQFAGAPSWTTVAGIVDDYGISGSPTDNTNALKNIVGGTDAAHPQIIIFDCPHGGGVKFSQWHPPSHLIIWQKPNCRLYSTVSTLGLYPLETPGNQLTPDDGLEWHGLQLTQITPLSGLRALALWVNNLELDHFDISGTGFGLIRGSNQLFQYGHVYNVPAGAGNAGARMLANTPFVPTSPGRCANVCFRWVNFETGDSPFQGCQSIPYPGVGILNWFYAAGPGIGTNDLKYEYVTGTTGTTAFLVNEQITLKAGDSYACDAITIADATLSGRLLTIIDPGSLNSGTHNIRMSRIKYDGSLSTTVLASLGIGWIKRGPFTFSGRDLRLVRVESVTINNALLQAVEVAGPFPWIIFKAVSIGPTQRTQLRAAVASISGTIGFSWGGGSIAMNSTDAFGALSLGDNGQQTVGQNISGLSITGLAYGQPGINEAYVLGGSVTANSVATLAGMTGVGMSLTEDPNGTHGLTVTGNNVSAVSGTGINCAPGQANTVTANTGAPDCP